MEGSATNYLPRLARPETRQTKNIDKMHPECLKLASITQRFKLGHSTSTANNVANKEEKGASNASFGRREFVFQNENRKGSPIRVASRTGIFGNESLANRGGGFLRVASSVEVLYHVGIRR